MIMFVTFGLTVMVDLVFAVQIGVLLSVLYFFVKMSKSLAVELHDLEGMASLVSDDLSSNHTLTYHLQGPLFFGAVERLEQALGVPKTKVTTIILRFGWVPMIDITALHCLEKLIKGWHQQQIVVKFSGLNAVIKHNMKKSGLLSLVGDHNVISSN